MQKNKGITLIALVVTIIILLILAGISIAMLTGQNGILNRAQEAKEKTETSQEDENEKLQGYESTIEQYVGKIPEGLQVGETVKYSPSGTYNWQAKYCSATLTEDVTLSSKSGEAFNLTEWKVLSIENGKVELIPTKPTEGTVYLGQAQGYNNGVKLLNDACNGLYSNKSKGITARSLNMEDIEKYMEKTKLIEVHSYANAAKYGEQVTTAYGSNKNYPTIYESENLSVVDGSKKTKGLGMSEQDTFIERTDAGGTDGKKTATTSIQPYQTYWYKDNSYMQGAFKTATSGVNYYDLLIPQGPSTYYWIASRCVNANSGNCNFDMCYVNKGYVNANYMYDSGRSTNDDSNALFPVVSLNASLISKDETNGFTINVE